HRHSGERRLRLGPRRGAEGAGRGGGADARPGGRARAAAGLPGLRRLRAEVRAPRLDRPARSGRRAPQRDGHVDLCGAARRGDRPPVGPPHRHPAGAPAGRSPPAAAAALTPPQRGWPTTPSTSQFILPRSVRGKASPAFTRSTPVLSFSGPVNGCALPEASSARRALTSPAVSAGTAGPKGAITSRSSLSEPRMFSLLKVPSITWRGKRV